VLNDRDWEEEYMTGGHDPLTEFYIPALSNSNTYWRASGYFSSSVFDSIGDSMGDFVQNDGRMDLVTSVHLSQKDRDAIESGLRDREDLIEERLKEIIEQDFTAPLPPGVQVLAKLLEINRLNIKIATTDTNKLFHIKMGVFIDEEEDYLSFSGSQNESQHSIEDAFEGIDVYASWVDTSRAEKKRDFFERLWNNEQEGAKVHNLPASLSKIIVKKYRKTKEMEGDHIAENGDPGDDPPPPTPKPPPPPPGPDDRYAFQDRAVEWFVDPEGADGKGLYWMATGTGKTITAFKTINKLFDDGQIDHVVINTKERLLHQWAKEMRKRLPGTEDLCTPWKKRDFWQISGKKQMALFRQQSGSRNGHALFITYSFLPSFVDECRQAGHDLSRTLLIVDEVHNIGSDQNVQAMTAEENEEADESLQELHEALRPTMAFENSNLYHAFGYRLGLSATPMSDFDDIRNHFILNAFTAEPPDFNDIPGWSTFSIDQRRQARIDILANTKWSFYYGLEEAIRDGILVPFKYLAEPYEPSDEEEAERIRVMKYWKARVADGTASPAAPAIHMARVYKKCEDKLRAFRDWLDRLTVHDKERALKRALIFVDNTEFGGEVVEILFNEHDVKTHTFFSGDDENMVERFSVGELDNLITCHMISEGLDIESVSSIILFSSDRQRLETIQRIGRALRKNPNDPEKVAQVLDFIYIQDPDEDTSDAERYRWLSELGIGD